MNHEDTKGIKEHEEERADLNHRDSETQREREKGERRGEGKRGAKPSRRAGIDRGQRLCDLATSNGSRGSRTDANPHRRGGLAKPQSVIAQTVS